MAHIGPVKYGKIFFEHLTTMFSSLVSRLASGWNGSSVRLISVKAWDLWKDSCLSILTMNQARETLFYGKYLDFLGRAVYMSESVCDDGILYDLYSALLH